MNKLRMRWISLVLSMAVMIGSLAYIATGFYAETADITEYIVSASSTTSAGKLLDGEDIISTDNDRMSETAEDTWVYETVLREGGYLVNADENADIYLDMVNGSGTSVAVGDKIEFDITMENITMNDVTYNEDTGKNVSAAVDVEAISFSIAYDSTYMEFVSGKSNIEGVQFTATGSGLSASLLVSYKAEDGRPKLRAHEIPVFSLQFEAVKDTVSTDAAAYIQIEDSAAVTPDTLTVKACQPEEYRIYKEDGNSALSSLTMLLRRIEAVSGTDVEVFEKIILNPEFDPEVNNYFITVPYDAAREDINVRPVAADPKAKTEIKWSSEGELEAGIHSCTVTVTADDGSSQDYKIVVKKLALDTLADPKTTIVKTVKLVDDGTGEENEAFRVSYDINGKNNLLAGGNDYVVYITGSQENTLDLEAIRANTANLEDSTLTVVDASSERKVITTYSSLAGHSLKGEIEYKREVGAPEDYILSDKLKNDNKYLILVGGDAESAIVTKCGGYTEILLPDDANVSQHLTNAGIDNTAAEFVFIADFSCKDGKVSDEAVNGGIVKSLFGFSSTEYTDIPGYIQQVRNMLTNDSTAKITIIAIGADIDAEEWESYGIQFVTIPASDAVLTDNYDYDFSTGVYCGQTYNLPQAVNELWGFTATESEQHNLWAYADSFGERNIGSSTSTYEQAAPAGEKLLADQYEAAMLQAKALLKDANNAQLIVLTPNSDEAEDAYDEFVGADSGIVLTIAPVEDYTSQTNEDMVAKEIYDYLVMKEKAQFVCDPAGNSRYFELVEPINRKVFRMRDDHFSMGIDGKVLEIDTKNTSQVMIDAVYYLPAIGEYDLHADYVVYRLSGNNIVPETHYYPITSTLTTEVAEDETVMQDDIPAVAPSYDDEYELTVTKAIARFEDANGVIPEDSTITYVLLYTNTGTYTLTNVGITDSQIMLAGNDYKVYLLEKGKLAPGSSDFPLGTQFTATGDGNQGEATVKSLEPGQTIYVEYTITIPEMTKVTTGTTRVEAGETEKVITSYIIDNIATGASDELEAARVEVKVEFEYDKESGGTVSTSPTSGKPTESTSSTTDPTSSSTSNTSTSSTSSSTSTTSSRTTTSSTTRSTTLPTVTTYSLVTTTSTKIIYKEDIKTGESSVGYIVAMSLLFGAIGVFGVTIHGIVLDKRIERAAAASGRRNILR